MLKQITIDILEKYGTIHSNIVDMSDRLANKSDC